MWTLIRDEYRNDGIFGKLYDDDNILFCVTLEHAYSVEGDSAYAPKVPEGIYQLIRSKHRLEGMTDDFTTFQVVNVPNHTNILIHPGNFNKDSDGCILVGKEVVYQSDGSKMITQSRATFERFMKSMEGIDQGQITIKKDVG